MPKKDPAAIALGKKRWRGVSNEERHALAKHAVEAREQRRKERRKHMERQIQDAHVPSWLKFQLLEVSGRRSIVRGAGAQRSYAEVGYHLGFHHLESAFDVDPDNVPAPGDAEALANPSKTLRAIFATEAHPSGDFVDYIPTRHRREFLRGLLIGVAGWDIGNLEDN